MAASTISVAFGGTDEYADGGNIAALTPGVNRPFSVSLAFKCNAGAGEMVTKQASAGNLPGWAVRIAGNEVEFELRNAAGARLEIEANVIVNDNRWWHCVVTYDGSGNAAGALIYLNSVPMFNVTVNADTLGAADPSTATPFQVGAQNATNPFTGSIDEVAYWDNVTLTQAQVTTIFGNGDLPDLSAVGPAPTAYWRMGESAAFPTINATVGANNLTMTNMEAGDIATDAMISPKDKYDEVILATANNAFEVFGPGLPTYFVMRGKDSGAPTYPLPTSNLYWVVQTLPDFVGTYAPSAPFGGPIVDIVALSRSL